MWAIYLGVIYGVIESSYGKGITLAVGSIFGVAFGWGKYTQMWGKTTFGVGYNSTAVWSVGEKEFWPADRIGDQVYWSTDNAVAANVVAMGIRYGVMFIPMFFALGYFTESYGRAAFAVLAMFGTGLVYYWAGKLSPKEPNELAEYMVGAMIAFLITLMEV